MAKNAKLCPSNATCGMCAHMTNVEDENREEANVMGGCFMYGHVTFTDQHACIGFKPFVKSV